MNKRYEAMTLEILFFAEEDAVRCSGEFTYEYGDSVAEDIFD